MVVEMRTDFVLGVEATSGTLFVDDVEVAAPRFGVEDDGRAGVRIAELGDVLPGSHTFRLELAGPAGRMLAEQHLRVDVRNGIAVTLLVQRRCSGVECTVAGMTACYAGECVDDRCSPETPEHCPTPECETDADCGVHCGTSACVDGACFLDPTACYDTRLVVTVTCDNTYGVGLGPSLDGYFTQDTLQAHEIFACSATCLTDADCGTGACSLFASCDDDGYGPERHVWDVADLAGVDTLYITAWDHTGGGGGQGFSAEVRGPVGRAVTGDDRFEVCATNMEAGGTDAVMMAARIADCDARDGWLGATGPFPRLAIGAPPVPVCQAAGRGDALPADAEWVWYAPDETTDPFLDTSPGEVLIFRVRLDGVVR
ncbi:MAG: hypothetical protein KC486_21965, partial [Myxococcales bacterium]|nr:hypothetical protein [Myxococcales bacterium]